MPISNYVPVPGGWIAIGLTRGWAGLLQIVQVIHKSSPHTKRITWEPGTSSSCASSFWTCFSSSSSSCAAFDCKKYIYIYRKELTPLASPLVLVLFAARAAAGARAGTVAGTAAGVFAPRGPRAAAAQSLLPSTRRAGLLRFRVLFRTLLRNTVKVNK